MPLQLLIDSYVSFVKSPGRAAILHEDGYANMPVRRPIKMLRSVETPGMKMRLLEARLHFILAPEICKDVIPSPNG